MKSLQEANAPDNACFGCGPANPKGLQIRSFEHPDESDVYVCTWRAQKHHEAFEGMLNGGIIGALLDCHSNWSALIHLKKKDDRDDLPCTVTADFHVKLRRPTPSDAEIHLTARIVRSIDGTVEVESELEAGGKVCATCTGTFVEVKEGHPAFVRW